jgi:hypothetical protein
MVAECVYVLESFYEVPRERVAQLTRAAIELPSIRTVDPASSLRALEIYRVDRLGLGDKAGGCGHAYHLPTRATR